MTRTEMTCWPLHTDGGHKALAEQYSAAANLHSTELGSASQASQGHSVVANSAGGQLNAQETCCWRRWRRALLIIAAGAGCCCCCCCTTGAEEVTARRGTAHVPHCVAFDVMCTFPSSVSFVALYAAVRPSFLKTSASTMKPDVRPAGSPSMVRYHVPRGRAVRVTGDNANL